VQACVVRHRRPWHTHASQKSQIAPCREQFHYTIFYFQNKMVLFYVIQVNMLNVVWYSEVYSYCHVYGITIDGFGFIIRLVEHLQIICTSNNNSSWIYRVYNSLWHTFSLLSLLCLHQGSLVKAFNSGFSPSVGFLNCPCASAAETLDWLTNQLSITATHNHSCSLLYSLSTAQITPPPTALLLLHLAAITLLLLLYRPLPSNCYSVTAPSLRLLVPSISMIRCELVQVYDLHLPLTGEGKKS
jgi:hypothetical protein